MLDTRDDEWLQRKRDSEFCERSNDVEAMKLAELRQMFPPAVQESCDRVMHATTIPCFKHRYINILQTCSEDVSHLNMAFVEDYAADIASTAPPPPSKEDLKVRAYHYP